MREALDGPAAKLMRAYFHLDCLTGEVVAFEASPQARCFVLDREYDQHTTTFVGRVSEELQFPMIFAVLIGDVLHNARSALDHLAYCLAARSGRKENKLRQTQFPIIVDGDDWSRERVANMVRYINPDDRALIEAHQPFRSIDHPPADHVLATLNTLSNRDKHRLLIPVAGQAAFAEQDIVKDPIDCTIVGIESLRETHGPQAGHGSRTGKSGPDRPEPSCAYEHVHRVLPGLRKPGDAPGRRRPAPDPRLRGRTRGRVRASGNGNSLTRHRVGHSQPFCCQAIASPSSSREGDQRGNGATAG